MSAEGPLLCFVDTNVLVYARDASEPEKQPLAAEWMARLWHTRQGRLSFQVLTEFYVTVTHKLKPGLGVREAQADVRALIAWQPVPVDDAVLARGWSVQARYGTSWWDALIVAAAQIQGCSVLLSEDLGHNQDYGSVRVLNPFIAAPAESGL